MIVVRGNYWGKIIGLDGLVRRRLRSKNAITTAALNDIASVYLAAGTQKTTWFSGLIGDTNFDELADADTAASHAGWEEFQSYSESVRQTWTPGVIAGGIVSNPTDMSVTITTGGVLKGAFMISDSTKGGVSGFLLSTGLWDTDEDETVVAGEQFKWGWKGQLANG